MFETDRRIVKKRYHSSVRHLSRQPCKTRRWRKYSDILRMYLLYVATISLQKYFKSTSPFCEVLTSTHFNLITLHCIITMDAAAARCRAAARCHLLNQRPLLPSINGATTAAVPSPCHQSPRNMPPPPPTTISLSRPSAPPSSVVGRRSSVVNV